MAPSLGRGVDDGGSPAQRAGVDDDEVAGLHARYGVLLMVAKLARQGEGC